MDLFHLHIVDNDPDLPELAFRVRSKQKVLDLLTSTEDEKSEWVEAIRKAVDEQENKIGNVSFHVYRVIGFVLFSY